ncbi:ANTAR domain-containing response regulator [Tropicimonas sp. IMCC6043]|uniref:ANTAR domain-containing response regulator n=1 Tax=Tropicimonas sp. IMCC6043 TaxID=2510645 RepID=UPI00101D6697|nr:transcriptional antiterminator [Tropicimonas sp. IMCC6043]RYH07865.1 transcriptional antiterminator [Tropicimonas sp. IMCC6043]
MTGALEINFAGRTAAILHPAKGVRKQLIDRLSALGVVAAGHWPTLPEADLAFDFLLVDIDMGHDEQIPWEPGSAPIPMIGLIRSESPGRLDWALRHNFDAFLSQAAPGLIYSSLVVATAKCDERQRIAMREAETARRAGMRQMLIQAVISLMQRDDIDEIAALKRLRAFAMIERLPLEDAAARLLEKSEMKRGGGRR